MTDARASDAYVFLIYWQPAFFFSTSAHVLVTFVLAQTS